MPILTPDNWAPHAVRVRATASDPYAGLQGHAYIAARNLNPPVTRIEPHGLDRQAAALNILAQRGAIRRSA